MDRRFDALIVGGGPAGAVAAWRLARLGWRCGLIEQRRRHQPKTCGHCLNPRALALLKHAGLLDQVQHRASGVTRSLRVHVPHDQPIEAPLQTRTSPQCGVIIERSLFDQLLIDHASDQGVEVVQPATARLICGEPGKAIVDVTAGQRTGRLQCKLILGADGLGSAVARAAGLMAGARIGRKYGFSFDFYSSMASRFEPGTIEMFIIQDGYLGVVNQGHGTLHVAGLVSAQRASNGRDPFEFVRKAAAQHRRLDGSDWASITRRQVNHFAAVGPMPWRPHHAQIAHEWAALIGDAAGYVEPFTGQGMSWAIESAMVLGDVISRAAPGQWNGSMAGAYRRAWRLQVGQRQRLCQMTAFGLDHKRLAAVGWRAARLSSRFTRHVVQRVVAE